LGVFSLLKTVAREVASIVYNLTIGIFRALEEQSIEVLNLEYLELENAFLSLVLGGMMGLHLVPMGLAVELLPDLKDEISIMEKRHFLGGDVVAEYFSSMGGEW